MTFEPHERDLALYVEGDLPQPEAARLERHLRECPRCLEFLRGLKDSQRELKALAAEPIEADVLVEVRERVLAVLGGPIARPGMPAGRGHPPRRAWGLALAAGLGVVALGLALVWRTRPAAPRETTGPAMASPTTKPGLASFPAPAEVPAATSPRRSPEAPTAALSSHRSTVRPARAVSQGREPDAARPVPTLSPEDADQLAKAVVAVSRIRRLSDRPATVALTASSPGALVRLETPDPSVVIYWQLDSNGG